MKWFSVVFGLAVLSYVNQPVRAANPRYTCALNLVGTSVEQLNKAMSPLLNDIRTDIRKMSAKLDSTSEEMSTLLLKIAEEFHQVKKAANCLETNRPEAPPSCTMMPRSGIPDSKKTYYFCHSLLDAAAAQAFCQSHGMSLATVETEEMFNYISGSYAQLYGVSSRTYFLGASDSDTPGSWYWTPSHKPLTFAPWAAGAPSKNQGHCLLMVLGGSDGKGAYRDAKCNRSSDFICEHKCA